MAKAKKKKEKEFPNEKMPQEVPKVIGIVRAPKIIRKKGRVLIDLGLIDSPALLTGVSLAVSKTALELKQLKSLTEYAVELQRVFATYAEEVKICDCPICQAKLYVDSKLNPEKEGAAPLADQTVGAGGHYL